MWVRPQPSYRWPPSGGAGWVPRWTDRRRDSEIIGAARDLHQRGLNAGTSGNLSVRSPLGFRITPSRVSYARMRPRDLVTVAMDGTVIAGSPHPSIEFRLHLEIYCRRPDVQAVVHMHGPYATAWSCRGGMPPWLSLEDSRYYDLATLPVVPRAPAGSRSLADATGRAIISANGVLLANHGAVTVGGDLAEALARAEAVEHEARVGWILCAGAP
jgi:L-fuculose-phosphate aldolase